jgi:Uma2 family endonuclease
VVEVEDPDYPGNKGFKLAEYARAGVPETWVVDVINPRVAFHRQGRYDRPEVYPEGGSIALPLGAPDPARIEVSELF